MRISIAGNQHRAIVGRMLKAHLGELGARASYPHFMAYWSQVTRYPYLFTSGAKVVGFALVRQLSSGPFYEVAEFFVSPSSRGRGVGAKAFRLITRELPGRWRISVGEGNLAGVGFWASVAPAAPQVRADRLKFEASWPRGKVGAI